MTDDGFTLNRDYRFDIMVSEAAKRESELARWLLDAGNKVEVKSESFKKWGRSGKIAIEFASRGHPSGLAVTEADVWVQQLYGPDGRIVANVSFDVPRLKEICRGAFRHGRFYNGAGDDRAQSCILLPLWRLWNP